MLKLKIFHKLFGSLVLVSTVVLLVLAVLSWYTLDIGFLGYLQQKDDEHSERLCKLLLREYQQQKGWQEISDDPGRWVRIISLADEIDILDVDDETLLTRLAHFSEDSRRSHGERRPRHSRPPPGQGRNRRPPPGPQHFIGRMGLYDENRLPIYGKDAPPKDAQVFPLVLQEKTLGYLAVSPLREVSAAHDVDFLKEQTRDLALVTLLLIALAALLALYLARHFERPIKALALGARRLSSGAFATRVAFNSNDELGSLARDFNNLAHTLENNEKARQRWTADISHELRTPLAVLRGELEALRDGVRLVDDQALASLHSETLYLGKLVNDLYDLSLADIGALTYQKQAVDPVAIFDQVAGMFRSRLTGRKLTLTTEPDSTGGMALADDNRLRQLFTNLLENSCRYTDPGGFIRFSSIARPDCLALIIEDSAPAPKDCSRLFERFHREERSRNRAKGGAGLGLAICLAIVEAHNGTISASPSVHGGLRIEITLPLE